MTRPRLFPFGVDAPALTTPDITVTATVPLTVVRQKNDRPSRLELARGVVAVVNGEVVP